MRQLPLALICMSCITFMLVMMSQRPPTAHAQDNGVKAVKWEYLIISAQGRYPRVEEMNQAGEKGWELVSSEFIPPNIGLGNGSSFLYFKRVKQ